MHASGSYGAIVAVDPSATARAAASSAYPETSFFASIDDVTGDLDVVAVATPAPLHEPVARTILARGVRALLLEKPMACNADVAASLLHDVKERGIPLVVPHGMLVLPAPAEIKGIVRQGDIGDVLSVDVQNSVDLLNAGVHWLVYLLDLFDDDLPVTVESQLGTSGRTVSDGVRVEDSGRTRIVTQSGCRWTLWSGKATRPASAVLSPAEQIGALFRLTGTTGTIEFSAWSGSYRLVMPQFPEGKLVSCDDGAKTDYHRVFLEQLADGIASPRPDYRSAELSVAALRLIDCAYRPHVDPDWQPGQPASKD